jgi:hypothetical protein
LSSRKSFNQTLLLGRRRMNRQMNALTKQEVEMLGRWDRIASRFRRSYLSSGSARYQFKEYAYREVYGALIAQTIQGLPKHLSVLKTDSWNEGVEDGRNLIGYTTEQTDNRTIVCIDVSRFVCESARIRSNGFAIVRATLLASPFRPIFDLVIDASTIDHMPLRLRRLWLAAEASVLKPHGCILISFDCRLNMFTELYHRFFTRKIYPEWTLTPTEVRGQLESLGFAIAREHAIFVSGFIWGSHRPSFILARLLRRRGVLEFIKNRELSTNSKWLSFIAPQYVIVARKKQSC